LVTRSRSSEAGSRYRLGESLLPGTLSILTRLGVADTVNEAGFVRKKAATFIWGGGRPPWSFTFGTPKTAPWVYDHSLQVTRAEYDHILLKAAAEHGAEVREECEVSDVNLSTNGVPSTVTWKDDAGNEGTLEADFVIDASGLRGSLSQKLTTREWTSIRNMAIWSLKEASVKATLEHLLGHTMRGYWISSQGRHALSVS
jgi:2-polyprenyl-6-methoxyphenol hydroxylase-like FAD-dependent oxidoreductase